MKASYLVIIIPVLLLCTSCSVMGRQEMMVPVQSDSWKNVTRKKHHLIDHENNALYSYDGIPIQSTVSKCEEMIISVTPISVNTYIMMGPVLPIIPMFNIKPYYTFKVSIINNADRKASCPTIKVNSLPDLNVRLLRSGLYNRGRKMECSYKIEPPIISEDKLVVLLTDNVNNCELSHLLMKREKGNFFSFLSWALF